MSWILIVEQSLNGLQFGLMLFLLAAGLTLVFGVMDMINLAHGSLYMVGAYTTATAAASSGSFALGLVTGVAATAVLGMALELTVLRRLYQRDHLAQVLGTFAILLMANVKLLFTAVFGLGAALCALAGGMLGPLLAVQVGMGESILILAFVVVVIGGIGSIRGALVGALLVGLVDASARTFVPLALES